MILQIEQVFDLGDVDKQRILFRAVRNGNLSGHHLLQGNGCFYSFPYCEVKKSDYVVLYICSGDRTTRKYHDAVCHFLYYGKQLCLWEEQAETFCLIFRAK